MHVVYCFVWVPSKTLKGFYGFAVREWTSILVRGKDLSMTGGSLDRGASRCDPKRGQRQAASEFSVPDSEGKVFEGAGCCFENAEEFHGRHREGCELHVRGRALHELRRVAAAW